MKRWDLLLEWMTHLGSGEWGAFREAVAELGSDNADEEALLRTLRVTLSDLGHADFFVDGSRRWRVLRPALIGLSGSRAHLFVGGRTRLILERLRRLVPPASLTVTEDVEGLSRVQLTGDSESLIAVAKGIGLEYVADVGAKLCGRLPPVRSLLEAGQPAEEPINWSVRSWSFQDERWVNERLQHTVREYSNRHGARRYLLHVGKSDLREIEKRASVYCAALVRGARIVGYSRTERRLHVPRWAPLPAIYARTACLAGGQLGALSNDEILFNNIDSHSASMLLVGLGQGLPMQRTVR